MKANATYGASPIGRKYVRGGDVQSTERYAKDDLLAVDKDANLVVVELKRTETGEYMDLQAIRYAAMVSTLTFKRAVELLNSYQGGNYIQLNPRVCFGNRQCVVRAT